MPGHILYRGIIRHRRFRPVTHEFRYGLAMFSFDLDRMSDLARLWPITGIRIPALGWFRRKDYVGPADTGLKEHVLSRVEEQLGFRPGGRVTLLTHLRMWGVIMNPIAVFCCYCTSGKLQAVALQVTNTPWGEQILYVLKADPERDKQHFEFPKAMHVSPFNPMEMTYTCNLVQSGDSVVLHLENHGPEGRDTDATLVLEGQDLDLKRLAGSVFVYPYLGLKVYFTIYTQAFRLYRKRTRFYAHPDSTGQVNTALREIRR